MRGKYEWIEQELADAAARGMERFLIPTDSDGVSQGTWITMNGKRLLNLSSNNYLGLGGDTRLTRAIPQAVDRWGTGATASRLVAGNYALYDELERDVALWKGREAALLFPNGFMANLGVISALVGRGDAVFSDRYNHASIVDGIILSRAEHMRFRHNDMEHLEFLLKKHEDTRRKLIVTDAIFSMDGDAAPLEQLVRLRNKYNALLFVDEAHASGIFGTEGQGLCHSLGLHQDVDVLMGTFSKAFGVYGAYICGDQLLIRYLLNKARSLIYTTGLPPAVLASVKESLCLIKKEHQRRTDLQQHSRWFRQSLQQAGFSVPDGDSPIIPLLVGENELAIAFSKQLREEGIAAVAIRPPTVPDGTARLRFSLMATHTREDLQWALDTIIRTGKQWKVISG